MCAESKIIVAWLTRRVSIRRAAVVSTPSAGLAGTYRRLHHHVATNDMLIPVVAPTTPTPAATSETATQRRTAASTSNVLASFDHTSGVDGGRRLVGCVHRAVPTRPTWSSAQAAPLRIGRISVTSPPWTGQWLQGGVELEGTGRISRAGENNRVHVTRPRGTDRRRSS
jgi:hypothetical protein